ncbi:hypothetical protein QA640_41575 [Bradyrhizobium sp. CB82]|uniref:hypothetical protein n=1 Tax=Bradyrhizobium sp. CB82 TaxID=3039159 RepID=UPI0024B16967|nr:hypothetical protein [Bradyrhizobium sp. CB82]WFU40588.1 hypothetical protein QA640_41575 [Bradyrhizobium sp. CB82]
MMASFEKRRMVRLSLTIEGLRAPIDYLGGHARDPDPKGRVSASVKRFSDKIMRQQTAEAR